MRSLIDIFDLSVEELYELLDTACDMLRDPDLKITDIAFHLHYDSLSYFLRAFKKRFGMTPTEYRAQLKVQRMGL